MATTPESTQDATPTPKPAPSLERIQEIIAIEREKKLRERPDWFYLAGSAYPDMHREAERLYQERCQLDATNKIKSTAEEKWASVTKQLQDEMPEKFARLNALKQFVEFWTFSNSDTIAKAFEGANTEEERLDILLGRNLDLPREHLEVKVDSPKPSDPEYETDESLEFILEPPPSTHGKNNARNRRYRDNKKKRAAAQAAAQKEEQEQERAPDDESEQANLAETKEDGDSHKASEPMP